MKPGAIRLFLCMVVVLCAGAVSGCTTSAPESKPLPELTFQHITPLPVQVSAVAIENRYDAGRDPHDVSSSFPTPPDIVLRRYAENRLQPVGVAGTLKFIIEDAHVYQSLVRPAGKFTGWMGLNKKDLYEIDLKIRMYTVTGGGEEGVHSILNIRRSIAIPHRFSVAQKEREKFLFLELLMKDIDNAVTDALKNRVRIVE